MKLARPNWKTVRLIYFDFCFHLLALDLIRVYVFDSIISILCVVLAFDIEAHQVFLAFGIESFVCILLVQYSRVLVRDRRLWCRVGESRGAVRL